jgi:transmembrane sensor
MDDNDIKLLLARYITNQASEAEAREVKHWIGLNPENELYFIELYEAWQNMLHLKPKAIDEEKAYQLFLDKVAPKKHIVNTTGWLKYAAVLLVALGSYILFTHLRPTPADSNRQVVAKNGAIKKIILTDSTIVWLNAGSTLKYNADFGKTNRTVYLEGEAFFDIGHHNKSAPFVVNTKNYAIRDIGTKFNLKAYPNDPFFETTVVKGEVAVQANLENNQHDVNLIYLKPHQLLRIYYHPEKKDHKETAAPAHSYNEVDVSEIDAAKMDVYAGWKDDLLVFDGNTLSEISRVLERRYNVQIDLNDSELQNIRYSGSFKNIPDIDKVLSIIKQNTPIKYTIDGQKVTITKTN